MGLFCFMICNCMYIYIYVPSWMVFDFKQLEYMQDSYRKEVFGSMPIYFGAHCSVTHLCPITS